MVTTTYDTQGLPATLEGDALYVDGASYNALGQPALLTFGGPGLDLQIKYDYYSDDQRLKKLRIGESDWWGRWGYFAYEYDDVGNVTLIEDRRWVGGTQQLQTQSFGYDALDRLTSASTGGLGAWGTYSHTYAYDALGNITYHGGLDRYYKYSGGKPHAVTHLAYSSQGAGTQMYWYDANGAMIQRIEDGVTYQQSWDPENRLQQVSHSGYTTTLVYDGHGSLVSRTVNGETTVYVAGLYEKNLSTGQEVRYYYLGGQRVAMRRGSEVYYLAGDHLGTTSVVLDDQGQWVAESRHYPYGEERWSSGTLPTDRRFTGQKRIDSAGGIYHMGARFYDSQIGRWTSPDTIIPDFADPQSFNRYSYCLANPLRFVDPSGHDPLDAAWQEEFRTVHGRDPTWEDILIRLFSIAFPEEWSSGTWNALYTSSGQLRQGAIARLFSTIPEGRSWASMPAATEHMAGWYEQDETEAFIRDIGSLFGGLQNRFEQSSGWRAIRAGRAHNVSVFVGRAGLSDELLGDDPTGNIHHWAWALNLGYFRGREIGRIINVGREWDDAGRSKVAIETRPNAVADVWLGNIAVTMGSFMRTWPWNPRSPQEFRTAWHEMPLTVSVQ